MKVVRKASDLKFLNVGKKQHQKPGHFTQGNPTKLKPKESLFESEMYPNEQKIHDSSHPDQQQKIESIIEDPRISRLTHGKILLVEKHLFIITVLIFFCATLKVEVEGTDSQGKEITKAIMLIMDLTTVFLLLFIIMRKTFLFELQVDQKKVYIKKNKRNLPKNYLSLMFTNYEYVKELIIEIIIVLPHPSVLFLGKMYTLYDQQYKINVNYSINDLLGLFLIFKVYIVIRSIVALTIFSTPRASRICNYSGINHDFFFIIKCLQQEYPLRCSGVIFLLSMVIFGYAFRITEGKLSYYNDIPLNRFEDLLNCIWFTFITMATVGYGDIVVTTNLAKFIAVLLSILGVAINSQLIMALTQYLKMKSSQILSQTALERLNQQKQLEQEAAKILCQSIKIAKVMNSDSLDPLVTRKLKPYFVELKNKIDLAKAKYKRKKTILPSENITQQMIRSFQFLKDNFKEIYRWQHKLKHKIQTLQEQQGLSQDRFKNSFRSQVNNLLKTVT